MSSSIAKKIENKILLATENELASFTESLQILVHHRGRKTAELHFGPEYEFYDLASLTKILFGVTQTMHAFESGLKLSDPVKKHLPWWKHKTVTLKGVLSHSAGLPWWAPFYEILNLNQSYSYRREQVREFLEKMKLTRSKKSVYSDLDFILLGFLLEEYFEKNLFEIFASWHGRDAFPSFHFGVGNEPAFARSRYAPTEKCPWRKKVLQGEVHDDNTWAFGGVSTHAGLFGTIGDVANFGLELRKGVRGSKSKILGQSKTLKLFTKRAIPKSQGDWALGFMLPTKGSASCGKHFHATSFGHTGFTGTSYWYDPKEDLQVVILSNRVHPTRDNKKFVGLRPILHDIIAESL